MLFISLLIQIVALALHSNTNFNIVTPLLFTRIAAIVFIYSGALSFNALYIQLIGSGIGIYSGLFHVTTVSQFLDIFIFIIGSLILISWPSSHLTLNDLSYTLTSITNNNTANIQHQTTTHLKVNITNAAEYSLIVLFSSFGASLLVSSADLISMYLSIELQSFNALYIQLIGSGIGIYSGLFHVTTVSQFLDIFIFIIGSLILISWPSSHLTLNDLSYTLTSITNNNTANIQHQTTTHLKVNITNAAEYSLIVLFSSFGASLLVSSADLISMYLSIELQSFGVYILSTLYKDSPTSCNAGLKYFLLGAQRIRTSLNLCLQLSNSGDTLKHIVPSNSRKARSGQNNYLGMVTSYMMNESEMGYRGSKSEFLQDYVKEQRVDGSYCIKTKIMQLRCTLKGC